MIILLSVALAAAAPAAPATPPVDTHAQHQSEGMAAHEQMKHCCICCEEMMAMMHVGLSSRHEEHKSN